MRRMTAPGVSGVTGTTETQGTNNRSIGRSALVLAHRWAGLFLAAFLFVSGLTGAIMSWDHELDEWLNPQLFEAKDIGGVAQSPLALAGQLEAADPRLLATRAPLGVEAGENIAAGSQPRIDA